MAFCTECGTSVPDDVRFCTSCGKEREAASNPQVTAVAAAQAVASPPAVAAFPRVPPAPIHQGASAEPGGRYSVIGTLGYIGNFIAQWSYQKGGQWIRSRWVSSRQKSRRGRISLPMR
ncbi:MAG: zinc ribbon domain-containing protein [Propionibacteriaceae bacterium]|jgi:hypothetical protein|nr:zinc ribbon domain-containing protein [Propionibacteriaceae bacterium]